MTSHDGRRRRRLTPWRALTRTVVATEHDGSHYEVEVDYLDWGKNVSLYRDSELVEKKSAPAKFMIGDGARIELATSAVGIKRARLVTPTTRTSLHPIPGTWEYRRLRWDRNHPAGARLVSIISWLALAAAVILGLPQLVELVTQAEVFETLGWGFTSPIALSGEANTALTVIATAAAMERATRMKYNWWLEGLSGDLDIEP